MSLSNQISTFVEISAKGKAAWILRFSSRTLVENKSDTVGRLGSATMTSKGLRFSQAKSHAACTMHENRIRFGYDAARPGSMLLQLFTPY